MLKYLNKRQFSVEKLADSRQDELTKFAKEISNNLPGKHNIKIYEFERTTQMGNK